MTSACLLLALAVATADGLPPAPVTALAFAPGGASIVVATPHEVAELSWPDLNLKRKLPADLAHVHDLAFDPAGKQLAIAGGKPGESGRVALLSWPEGAAQRHIDAGDDVIYRAVWYDDGKKLALASADKTARLLSIDGGEAVALQEHSAAVQAVIAVPGPSPALLLTAGRDQTIRIWNPAAPEKSLRTFDNHTGAVNDLALRPQDDAVTPTVASAGADRTVRFWQPTIGRMVRFARLPSPPLAICWTANGQQVAAACQDGRVRIVDLQTARVAADHQAVDGWAQSIALAPDGNSVVVGGEMGQLKVLPLRSAESPADSNGR